MAYNINMTAVTKRNDVALIEMVTCNGVNVHDINEMAANSY